MRPAPIIMPPQELLAYNLQFEGSMPLQFTAIAVKQVKSDGNAKLQLTCDHPNTQQELPYDLHFVALLGVYYIEDAGKKYLVIGSDNRVTIKKAVLFMADSQTRMFTVDNGGKLCTAAHDDNLDSLVLTEVGRQTVSS